jgi:DNA-binding transcriptional ArsR family regulator
MEENNNTPTKYNENKIVNSNLIKDSDLSFIVKKTEKVATAIYMISNFFNHEEPLKWELRKNVTKLLKDMMSFNDVSVNREVTLSRINTDFIELNSIFNLSYNSGFISTMNYEIVTNEINNLSQLVLSYVEKQASISKSIFKKDYFEVKKEVLKKEAESPRENLKDNIKDIIKDRNEVIKDNYVFKGQKRDLDAFFNKDNTKVSDREQKILEKIKNVGSVTIKEISEDFKDVSEKTIQRELQKMFDKGQIKKEGERRWTKYFI